jgi:hypothetical protein
MSKLTFVLVLLLCVCVFGAHRHAHRGFPRMENHEYEFPLHYSVGYFDQKVSHFNFKRLGNFKQKYLLDTTYWNKTAKGPILFYCGNEGPV